MSETRVMYDGKRLIPAPFVSVNKTFDTAGDGSKIGSKFTLVVTGTLIAYKGSPDSTGTFYESGGYPSDETITSLSRLAAIERKIEALRNLFSTDGLQLEFQSGDGTAPMKCNPTVESINIEDGKWYDLARYSITLTTDKLYGLGAFEDNFEFNISAASENWSLQSNEQPQGVSLSLGQGNNPPNANDSRTYTLTHTVSATGKRVFNSDGDLVKTAWQSARDFVAARAGYDSTQLQDSLLPVGQSGVDDDSYGSPYNFIRSITHDEEAGTFSLTETWTVANQNYLEQYTVTTNESSDTGIKTVSISGTVTGLYERNSDSTEDTVTGYENADAAWSGIQSLLITRAQNYSGISNLNIVPVSTSVARNAAGGVINYTYDYNTRPSNIISDSTSEAISVSNNWGIDIFAEQYILGRTKGPLLQDIGTHAALKRNLSIEAVFPPASGMPSDIASGFAGPGSGAMTDIQSIVDAANPMTYSLTAYVSSQNDNWDPISGRYSYSVEWTYENTDTTTAGLKSNI